MLKKITLLILSTILSLSLLSGCSLATKKIVYTVYPVGYLLKEIAGDTIMIESLQTDTIVQRANIAEDYQKSLSTEMKTIHSVKEVLGSEIDEVTIEDLDSITHTPAVIIREI